MEINHIRCIVLAIGDSTASLTISEEDNKILLYDHAGCDIKNILNAVGLTEKDLFNNVQEKPKVVAEYIYRDENGNPLYKVMRFEPKNFIQAKYDNGNWVFKMAGVRYVLYNLPNVIKSEEVYFVEGEKDADNLNKLGLVATTTVSGASSYSKRADEYAKSLKDKIVYIVPDNDKAGYKYAGNIKKSLDGIAKSAKILKIIDEIPNFKEKGDISDVIMQYGKEKTLEIIENLKVEKVEVVNIKKKEKCIYIDSFEVNEDNILSTETMEILYKLENQNTEEFLNSYGDIKKFCKRFRIAGFDKMYKLYKESKRETFIMTGNSLMFPGLTDKVFKTNRYEITQEGYIYEIIPNVGKLLVSYQTIVPIEKYINLETGLEKIKIAFFSKDKWNSIIVDKSVISSTQSIVKLSDMGMAVTSENAKLLIKYLSEIENLNKDIIPIKTSISRLGWCEGNVLAPYNQEYEFDNEKDIPYLNEKFAESGKLEDWIDFFRERRKYNVISRIVMASAVASILLKRIKQSGFTLHIWGESEYGKAQPLDTKIITPNGYKFMGDIKIGDYVIGGDGKKHKVTGVFPQGEKEIYEITFKDGRKTRCCKEHLWNVTTITRRNHKRGYTTMTLEDMMKKPLKIRNQYQYHIPLTKPVEYNTNNELPINPYLLGALIGDGCLTLTLNKANGSTNLYFNNSEKDVIEKVEYYLKEMNSYLWANKYTTNQHVIRNCKYLKDKIIELKLNCKSIERFIPEIYKTASAKNRLLLLQGLFDMDGTVGEKGELKYCTKSQKLAKDILQLCFSLGYRATIENFSYRPDEYYVSISANENVFSSEKHKNKMELASKKRNRKEDTKSLAITSIKKCGVEECQCIMIDSKEHTYLCDDFIVTHNTVSCMVGQSIFGNPSQNDNKGIGINFNLTNAGLEYKLNLYNNIPLFINEMQHQKDAKDYDKLLFMISEGKGKSRSTKNGGVARENSWNNIVITNGEKSIIKDNSNAGAYNRCLSCEITEYAFEKLSEVADFVKENYGTPIREILKHLDEYDCKAIYNNILETLQDQDITNKQKILEAVVMLGDKILTDIIFKDSFYLTKQDFENKTVKKKDVATEERAYEVVKDWILSEQRHFLDPNTKEIEAQDIKVEIYGKKMRDGFVAIIPNALKKILTENGYDFNEVINAWKRKNYIKFEKSRRTLTVNINGTNSKCIVLDTYKDIETMDWDNEEINLPF